MTKQKPNHAIALNTKMKNIGIIQKGDTILENICKSITLPAQKEIAQQVINKLQNIVKKAEQFYDFNKGLGLAAGQIGYDLQIAIVLPRDEKEVILLNPQIISQSNETDKQYEGCWSFFDVRGLVTRPLEIEIMYQTLNGEEKTQTFSNAAARLVAHEIDHLQGILYPSRMNSTDQLISYEEYKQKNQQWQY
jgi:peptide deformylase